ncbi:MAG: hypothetical protein FD177_703 [Desulfovibrionaceae bacterium]|nr:MAG: hypothetical protein FD177_703 [Desulfovibrionaceae bacterium]
MARHGAAKNLEKAHLAVRAGVAEIVQAADVSFLAACVDGLIQRLAVPAQGQAGQGRAQGIPAAYVEGRFRLGVPVGDLTFGIQADKDEGSCRQQPLGLVERVFQTSKDHARPGDV